MKILTKQDLEEMDIISLGSKIYPNRFLIPLIYEADLTPPYNIEEVFNLLFQRGKIIGMKEGIEYNRSEIRKALGIRD